MAVTFEETNQTLQTGDLGANTIPVIVAREINMGARRKEVFHNAYLDVSIAGQSGTRYVMPKLDRDEFTAATITESSLDTSGYTKTKMSPSEVYIDIGDIVYTATRISDVLREDDPAHNWVRASLQKMGEAMTYKIECDRRDTLLAGAGVTQAAATYGTLDYDDIIDCEAQMKNLSYWGEGQYQLYINPDQEADVTKDTRFTDTARYSMGGIPFQGLIGKYAACNVHCTEVMTKALALVVVPPTHPFGPAAVMVWKRRLKSENWRDEQYGRDLWLISARYGLEVKEGNGIGLITGC